MSEPVICAFRHGDGSIACWRHYEPARPAVGRFVVLHGIRSHGGWYTRSCQQLQDAGYEVCFLDRRGAGLNTAHRGDCPGYRRLIIDVIEFIQDLRRSRAHLPITLAGISWGGKLAAAVAAARPGFIDRLALLSPGFCPKVSPSLLQKIAIARASVRDPSRHFPIPLNEPELFTADPSWQQFVANDRYGLPEATARFLMQSVRFDRHLKTAVKRITTPSLLMLAGRDRIIDNAATRRFFVDFANCKRTIVDYADADHTLEFERPDHPFVNDLIRWIQSHGNNSYGAIP